MVNEGTSIRVIVIGEVLQAFAEASADYARLLIKLTAIEGSSRPSPAISSIVARRARSRSQKATLSDLQLNAASEVRRPPETNKARSDYAANCTGFVSQPIKLAEAFALGFDERANS